MGDTLVVGKSNSKRLQQIIRMCYKQSLSVILTEWAVNFHSFSVLGQIWFRLWVWPTYQMELRPKVGPNAVCRKSPRPMPKTGQNSTTTSQYPQKSAITGPQQCRNTQMSARQELNRNNLYPRTQPQLIQKLQKTALTGPILCLNSPKLNQKLSYIIYYERYNKRMKLHKGSIVFYWYRKNKNNGVNDNPECCKM